jgi:hypothetical protein
MSILKGILSSSSLQAPIEAKLHTGQATGLSNGVNLLNPPYIFSITPHLFLPSVILDFEFLPKMLPFIGNHR